MKYLFYIALSLCFSTHVLAQNLSSAQAKADLDFLLETLENTHNNPYLHIKKVDFEAASTEVYDHIDQTDSLSVIQLAQLCMPLIAKLGDAHSHMSWYSGALNDQPKDARLFGIGIRWSPEGNLKIEDTNLQQNGQKLLKINGYDAHDLFKEAMRYEAGLPAFATYYTEKLLFPIFLNLKNIRAPWIIETDRGSFTYNDSIPLSTLSKRLTPSSKPYTFSILEGAIGYLSYNRCEDYDAFNLFLKRTFNTLEEEQIDKLIIDISDNLGGDSSLNDLLLSYITRKKYRQSSGRSWKVSRRMKELIQAPLYINAFGKSFINQYLKAENGSYLNEDEYKARKPKKRKLFFEGKTAFIIGPKTFSSANFLADAIKTYQLSTLIGEPTGELTNDFGEQITLEMPNSKLKFTCSIAFDIGADGNPEKNEVVEPDILITENVLDFVKKWIREK